MKKMYITVGISASGKSSWAKETAELENCVVIERDQIRFNKVLPGSNWSTYKFTKKREELVSEIADNMFNDAVENGQSVIISDTNLNPVYRNKWVKLGEDNGYDVEIVDFDISLEDAWKRDSIRANGVGHSVISQQYISFLEYSKAKMYKANVLKPSAIIVDVDGTIANRGDRGPFEWAKVGVDTPRQFVIDTISSYQQTSGAQIIFLSGRDSVCRHETLTWIAKHFNFEFDDIMLYMREERDMRKDTDIKEELFWEHIADNYNVVAAFDDRPCIVRLWYKLGIPNVMSVANPYIEF